MFKSISWPFVRLWGIKGFMPLKQSVWAAVSEKHFIIHRKGIFEKNKLTQHCITHDMFFDAFVQKFFKYFIPFCKTMGYKRGTIFSCGLVISCELVEELEPRQVLSYYNL
jgi:hypothetical protein